MSAIPPKAETSAAPSAITISRGVIGTDIPSMPLRGFGEADVRFGSKADIAVRLREVRFTPKSVQYADMGAPRSDQCLLWHKADIHQCQFTLANCD
jgi:hypothetical protein